MSRCRDDICISMNKNTKIHRFTRSDDETATVKINGV